MRHPSVLFFAGLIWFGCLPGSGQSVLTARSGVVHFSEGSVFLDNQPVDQKFGTFPVIQEGSTLRTEHGRAEVLLTPGVFLRIDENSSIRMISGALNDTRVEFLRGSAILDSLDAPAGIPVIVIYKGGAIRFPKVGVCRLDSEPAPLLQVYSGEAQVTQDGKPLNIDTAHLFFLEAGTETKKFTDGTDDQFYGWARDRSEVIASENQLAAQTAKDPGDIDNGQTLPGVPDTGVVTPNYSIGLPPYSPFGGIYSMGSAVFDPYVPFGMGPLGMGAWGAYPVFYPVFLSNYRHHPGHSGWPTKPGGGPNRTAGWPNRPAGWTNRTAGWPHGLGEWQHRPGYSHWPSSATGISRYQPLRPPTFVPHTFAPRIGGVSSGFSRPVSARPAYVGVPHVAAGPHLVGHR